jgi:hypothetical protein
LGGRLAASLGRARGCSGGVGLGLSSDAQITASRADAESTASAESLLLLTSSISGAPDSSGQLVLTGETCDAFSGGPVSDVINGRGPCPRQRRPCRAGARAGHLGGDAAGPGRAGRAGQGQTIRSSGLLILPIGA